MSASTTIASSCTTRTSGTRCASRSPSPSAPYRQFFLRIPQALIEAARLDGASHLTIYRAIVLPLSRPALATVAILEFVARWNDFFWPVLILTDEHNSPAQLGLARFFQGERTQWALVMAVAVIISLPVLLVFLVGQRFLVDGAVTRRGRCAPVSARGRSRDRAKSRPTKWRWRRARSATPGHNGVLVRHGAVLYTRRCRWAGPRPRRRIIEYSVHRRGSDELRGGPATANPSNLIRLIPA